MNQSQKPIIAKLKHYLLDINNETDFLFKGKNY